MGELRLIKGLSLAAGLCLLLALSVPLAAQPAPCAAEETAYLGWKAIHMGNGLVDLYIVPEIGGRVIQVTLDGQPFFWVNPDLAGKIAEQPKEAGFGLPWPNYGGDKIWPAPQGWSDPRSEWPGPPDPVLDGGRFSWEILEKGPESASVRLTSPADARRTGLQFVRILTLKQGASKVISQTAMTNRSNWRVTWSIWEVAQIDASAPGEKGYSEDLMAYAPMNPQSAHPRGYAVLYGDPKNIAAHVLKRSGLFRLKFNYRVGKWALDSAGGWVAVANRSRQTVFAQLFEPSQGAQYPDKASVGFWINGAGKFTAAGKEFEMPEDIQKTPPYLESEVLSPLVSLNPGESYTTTVTWGLTQGSARISKVSGAGVLHTGLMVWEKGHHVQVSSIFSSYHQGSARLVFEDASGKRLDTHDLGAVTPLAARAISVIVSPPSGTRQIALEILDAGGNTAGILDYCPLPELRKDQETPEGAS